MPPCPICFTPMWFLRVLKGRELGICERCRHVSWSVLPSDRTVAEHYAREYTGMHGQDEIQDSHRTYYRDHANEFAVLTGSPLSDLAIADIGCSYPVFLEEARKCGVDCAIGIDWSDEARAHGRSRGVAVLTPPEALEQIPDRSLDVLRYSHTLEHLIDPVMVLRQHVRKLRDGGFVYITQPSIPVLRCAPAEIDLHDAVWPQHLHFFSPLSLLTLLRLAGLEPYRFYSVTDEDEGERRYGAHHDEPRSITGLGALRDRGEDVRGAANNYPRFFGMNSAMYARWPGAVTREAAVDAAARRERLCALVKDRTGAAR